MARKYQFKLNPDLPVDDAFLDHMDALLSRLGIDPEVAQHLVTGYESFVGQRLAAEAAQAQRAADAVRTELGSGYTAAIAKGQRAIAALGLSQSDLSALEKVAGTGPMARLLVQLGKRFDASGTTKGSDPLATPEQARAEIDRLSKDDAFHKSLRDKRHKDHEANLARWESLHAAAYPAPDPAAAPAPLSPPGGDDAAVRARGRINELIGDANFMGSLRDPSHPEHATNRETFDTLHAEAGIGR